MPDDCGGGDAYARGVGNHGCVDDGDVATTCYNLAFCNNQLGIEKQAKALDILQSKSDANEKENRYKSINDLRKELCDHFGQRYSKVGKYIIKRRLAVER